MYVKSCKLNKSNVVVFSYTCVCIPGTTGVNCEQDIKECDSSPCQFGTCIDEIGKYHCDCEDGFEGENCEIDINECELYT